MLANVGIIGSPDLVSSDSIDADYRNKITAAWEAGNPDLSWQLELYHGKPGPTLVAPSASASLLVVGIREHVGWSRLVHGSVSHFCLSHARCPVVAVPAGSIPARRAAPDLRDGTYWYVRSFPLMPRCQPTPHPPPKDSL